MKTKKVTHQLMLYTSSLPTLSWYDICMYVQTSNYIIFPLVCHMDNTVIRDIATLIVWVIIIIQGVCQKKKRDKILLEGEGCFDALHGSFLEWEE